MNNWVDTLSYIKREKDSFVGELVEVPKKEIPVPEIRL